MFLFAQTAAYFRLQTHIFGTPLHELFKPAMGWLSLPVALDDTNMCGLAVSAGEWDMWVGMIAFRIHGRFGCFYPIWDAMLIQHQHGTYAVGFADSAGLPFLTVLISPMRFQPVP